MKACILAAVMALGAGGVQAAPVCKDWAGALPMIGGYATSFVFAIDPQDRVNSRGARLETPLAIVQQDRANMHKFRKAGVLDEGEDLFASLDMRQLITSADLRSACYTSPADLEQIMMDPAFMQLYQADVFIEGNRLVIYLEVLAG